MWENIINFKPEEFECQCGCGENNIDMKLVEIMDSVRELVGFPMRVNSGYRCEKHNKSIGGADKSEHLLGRACDISATDGMKKFKLVDAAIKCGIHRVFIYNTFIHFDITQNKTYPYLDKHE